jgi:hypothetical protein
MKAPVTCSEEGGVYFRVKAHDRVKEGGASIAVAPWRGRGAAREEAAALPAHLGREEGEGGGGLGLVGWLGLPHHSGPKRSGGPASHWVDWAES